jgi:alpha-mannosidase
MELALRELEWTASLCHLQLGTPYPHERLDAIWQETLLYQFHDILPGSSIKRVYDESWARYEQLLGEVRERIDQTSDLLGGHIDARGMTEPTAVFNSLSWPRTEWVQVGDRWACVTVPPMGYTLLDALALGDEVPTVRATDGLLENDLLRVEFGPDGSIVSIYDLLAQRQVLSEGQPANRLAVYEDRGDAWDFAMDYADVAPRHMRLVSASPRVDGPRAVLKQVYRLGHSELVQEIALTAGSRRLDFRTRSQWREPRTMLRTSFPVDVRAESATFEIQFGHVRRPNHRNTSWDLARDEVAAHKWVDLSQRDYGVALLNDAKYGHKIKGNVLDLNLLRSVPYPGPRLVDDASVLAGEPHHGYTDQCDHLFTYALYPHLGDHIDGGVIQAGYALNVPLRLRRLSPHSGQAAQEMSFLELESPNVIVEAVKMAEGGGDLIIRLYESEHRYTRTRLHLNARVRSVVETDLLEEGVRALELDGQSVALELKPFEIKTLRVAIQ